MGKYTWDDIIINPNTEEAKNCIGKEVYYSDNPNLCLCYANNSNDNFCGIIREIKTDVRNPFVLKGSVIKWTCIIRKKEEPKPEPKYVPFKNRGEFVSAFEDNTTIMHVYGLWIYEKIGKFDEKIPRLVTEMWGDGVIVGSDSHTTKWKDLLERFVFENNEPCGKLQEKKYDT